MTSDIHKKPFTETTMLKLDIFRKFFKEWLPVFMNNPYIEDIYMFDFFAGSGEDSDGEPGSPLILLDEFSKWCHSKDNMTRVHFVFNEIKSDKLETLGFSIDKFLVKCSKNNSCKECSVQNYIRYENKDFNVLIQEEEIGKILINNRFGKFILIDQYGFKAVDEKIYKTLIDSPKTDFIFFISSSAIKRFQESEVVKKHFDGKLDFGNKKPQECHKVIADYYKDLIPSDKEYYLHSFTIQSGANYYGLIFGTNHTLGMEKFLKVCWEHDEYSGESNCNVYNDYEKGSLFYGSELPRKINQVKEKLESKILNGKICGNVDGLKFALKEGCMPKVFVQVIEELKKSNKVEIQGSFNKKATNIHKIKGPDLYTIKALP